MGADDKRDHTYRVTWYDQSVFRSAHVTAPTAVAAVEIVRARERRFGDTTRIKARRLEGVR